MQDAYGAIESAAPPPRRVAPAGRAAYGMRTAVVAGLGALALCGALLSLQLATLCSDFACTCVAEERLGEAAGRLGPAPRSQV